MTIVVFLLVLGSERRELRDGKLNAPGSQHCVRLHAEGRFTHATVLVNQTNAGELADQSAELDITGYLSAGGPNSIEVRGAPIERVWVWMSPLVYISSARLSKDSLEVTITNTTENTAQVEIGKHQFTVSPGTSATRRLAWPGGGRNVRMRALSDGLDREFIDEADAVETVIR